MRRGRPYVARFCRCGAEAIFAVQVLVRTLGPESRAKRKIKLGKAQLLCGQCVHDVHAYTDQLSDLACDAIKSPFRARDTDKAHLHGIASGHDEPAQA